MRPSWLLLQINAVTRFKGAAVSEDVRSRDSISRKPGKTQQPKCPEKQSLTGELPQGFTMAALVGALSLTCHIPCCELCNLNQQARIAF